MKRQDINVDVKDEEQKMLEELAEFVLRFNEKYQVLLNIKIKPMRKGLKGAE